MELGGYRKKNCMEQQNKNFDHAFYKNIIPLIEDCAFILLRVILFIFLLVVAYKNIDKWPVFAIATSAAVVLVMFRSLDFFELLNIFKAGTNKNYKTNRETDSGASITPEDVRKDIISQQGEKKIIKPGYPEPVNTSEGTAMLEILAANYGTPKKSIDIKKKLSDLIINNSLSTPINNEVAGNDPDYGTPKTLKVKYKFNGEVFEKEFAEKGLVKLP